MPSLAMKFKYASYLRDDGSSVSRPIIPILIHNPRTASLTLAHEALVDSGADYCIFSGEIADILGIDITTGELQTASGAVAGETRPVYFHRVDITVGTGTRNPRITIRAGFMPDLANNGHGLLGRSGFFDQFTFCEISGRRKPSRGRQTFEAATTEHHIPVIITDDETQRGFQTCSSTRL